MIGSRVFSEKLALAAGSAALAVAPVSADAKLVTSGTAFTVGIPPNTPPLTDISLPWDIDGDGNPEFAFFGFVLGGDVAGTGSVQSIRYRAAAFGMGAAYYFGGPALPGLRFIWGTDSYSIHVPASVSIGPTLAAGLETRAFYSGATFGPPILSVGQSEVVKTTGDVSTNIRSSTVRYYKLGAGIQNFGFSFKIGGNVHYGWGVMSIGVGDGLVIQEWTYDDVADEAVHVGSREAVVPVPPSALPAITMLALGAAGLRRLRKGKAATGEG